MRPADMTLPLPTRRLVKRLVEDIPAFDRYTARYGHDAAVRRFRSVEGHRVTREPLARAEIDHTYLDLFAIDDETLLPFGRPWFSACEDDYTRCILGMFVGFIPPSFLTVSLCLKDAFRPKTWLKEAYPDIRSDWPAHGVMRELMLDNGPEFHSDSLEQVCLFNGIEMHYAPRREDGMYVPILRVATPSKPTVKGLAEVLLEGMGAVDATRGTENERTRRVKYLMRSTGTRMLMIDEFQHFFDKGTKLIMHHVADWLKILVDETRCALVVAGLPSCQTVIDSNEQLAGRFHAPILMPRFSWQDVEQREEFIGILQAFHQVLGQHFQAPEFQREAMAFRFYCATGGLIGYLTKILRRSVWHAVAAERNEITLEDLCDAHEKAVWCGRVPQHLPRPFAHDFKLLPTVDLLREVSLIGTVHVPEDESAIPPAKPARSDRRKPGGESAAAALVAR